MNREAVSQQPSPWVDAPSIIINSFDLKTHHPSMSAKGVKYSAKHFKKHIKNK